MRWFHASCFGVASFLGGFVMVFFGLLYRDTGSFAISFDRQLAASVFSLPNTSAEATTTPLRILFVGDMMFDRHIRQITDAKGGDYLFSCIDPLFKSVDFVVGNLEGPITASQSRSVGTAPGSTNNYYFTFPTTTAALLARHNVRAVTIGNNHIYNFGQNGLRSTEKYLRDAGVGYFGGISGNEPVYRLNTHGLRLSFVGYNQFGGSSSQAVAEVISSERALGRQVIVFAHWGVEYSTSTTTTAPVARVFAENGATLIIGAHPHVVGPSERISNTLVYYSLGNFIFDQYFSEAVQHGLTVLVTLGPSGVVGVEEHPVTISIDGATCAR